MPNLPEQINNAVQEFIKGVKDILGDRAKKIILYGSYARGDANENSDIDLRIDKGQIRGGIALAGLLLDLESDLEAKVDLVTTGSLDAEFLEMIKGEEQLIYEAK